MSGGSGAEEALRVAEELYPEELEGLFDFLRIESVSGDPARAGEVRAAADWTAERLTDMGFRARVHATRGHPVVTGERVEDPALPTLLVYGHYDVQPPDPEEAWTTPPFEPDVREDRLYARGAVDDKGQLFIHLAAARAILASAGRLPVNLKFLVEGEEEVASPNLLPFVRAHREELGCQGIVISDTTMLDPRTPTLGASLRGGVKMEARVKTAARDLHSGVYGGVAPNAASVLARLLAALHDDEGRVAVPGFYEGADPDPELRRALLAVPVDESALRREVGVQSWVGPAGRSFSERRWMMPTLEVNGVGAGYQGPGPKSVIPAEAWAKISCRLVGSQEPDATFDRVREYLLALAPDHASVAVERWPGGALPWRSRVDGLLVRAARMALERVFEKEPVFAGEGGSIPIVPDLERTLEAPVLLLGFGLPDENAHAPDEWISLDLFRKGIRTAIHLLHFMRELGYGTTPAPSSSRTPGSP